MPPNRRMYTNPLENLRSYIMLKAGIQKDERLSDLEWVEDKIAAGDKLANMASDLSVRTSEAFPELEKAIREWKDL